MVKVKNLFSKILRKLIRISKFTLFFLLLAIVVGIGSIYWFETKVMDRSVPTVIQYAKHWTYSEYIQLIDFSGPIIQSENWLYYLDRIGSDPRCKAVVIQVNSPGGYATPSIELAQGIEQFKKKYNIPIIIFGRGLLASGAYYFASAADAIIVEPGTIIGSVGVSLIHVSLQRKYYEEGYDITVIKSGDKKDMSYSFRKPTYEELGIFKSLIAETYKGFVDFIIVHRGDAFGDRLNSQEEITTAEMKEYAYNLADGRIYNAEDALATGLVDRVGFLKDAIRMARQYVGGAQNIPIITYNRVFDGFHVMKFEVKLKDIYYNVGFHLMMRL